MKTHVMISGALALGLMAQVASAQNTTINLYDNKSRNAGYVNVNPRTGSVDIYDPSGKRLGYGRVAPGSREIDVYRPNGERELTGKPAVESPRSKP